MDRVFKRGYPALPTVDSDYDEEDNGPKLMRSETLSVWSNLPLSSSTWSTSSEISPALSEVPSTMSSLPTAISHSTTSSQTEASSASILMASSQVMGESSPLLVSSQPVVALPLEVCSSTSSLPDVSSPSVEMPWPAASDDLVGCRYLCNFGMPSKSVSVESSVESCGTSQTLGVGDPPLPEEPRSIPMGGSNFNNGLVCCSVIGKYIFLAHFLYILNLMCWMLFREGLRLSWRGDTGTSPPVGQRSTTPWSIEDQGWKMQQFNAPLIVSILSSCITSVLMLKSLLSLSKSRLVFLNLAPLSTITAGFHVIIGGTDATLLGYALVTVGLVECMYITFMWGQLSKGIHQIIVAIGDSETTYRLRNVVYIGIAVGGALCCVFSIAIFTPFPHPTIFRTSLIIGLAWCCSVVRNLVVVTVCKVKYVEISKGEPVSEMTVCLEVMKHSFGDLVLGALFIPLVNVSAVIVSGISWIVSELDCTFLRNGMKKVQSYCNIWGWASVAIHRSTFTEGSQRMYVTISNKPTILEKVQNDVTESLSTIWSILGGSIGALISGGWVNFFLGEQDLRLVVGYGFFMGFFLIRIVMGWPAGAVAAYYLEGSETDVEDPHAI